MTVSWSLATAINGHALSLITIPVLFRYYQQSGSAHAGVCLEVSLTRVEIDNGVVLNIPLVTGTTDADGVCTLNLWPNSRGSAGSQYKVVALYHGSVIEECLITVPEADSGAWPVLATTIKNAAPYPPISDAQRAVIDAQELVTQAQSQAVIATAKAVLTAADVVSTHADAATTAIARDAAQIAEIASLTHSQSAALSDISAFDSKTTANAAASTATAKAVLTSDDRVQTGIDSASSSDSASTATAQAVIATTKAAEAAASADGFPINFAQLATSLINTQTIVVQHFAFA